MKVLHTADWHIGKKLHGYDLLSDQEFILNQIREIAKSEAVDAMIIAGDLYDRSVPSEDSVKLLNRVIEQINLEDKCPIFAISGNHDSATRLSTGNPWYSHSDYHLTTQLKDAFTPIEREDTQFFLLPYFEPVDARIYFDDPTIRTIKDAMPRVIEQIKEKFITGKTHVLVSHFFVAGSAKTDSETKIEVGGLDGISGELLVDFDYVALGHLHGKDALSMENARYSGSPLKYSLSEKDQQKGVWIFDTKTKERRFVALVPKYDIKEIKGNFQELCTPEFYQNINKEEYLSILLDDRAVIPNLMNQLRQIYPRILQVERSNGFEASIENRLTAREMKEKSPVELTMSFFEEVAKEELTEAQKQWINEGFHSISQKGEVK